LRHIVEKKYIKKQKRKEKEIQEEKEQYLCGDC
jgi:hypothetical protein